jgi:hypothetical protein
MSVKSVLRLAVLLSLVIAATGCGGSLSEYGQHRRVTRAQKATPPFSPIYYKDLEQTHVAIQLEVADGRLRLAARPADRRPGKMPYHPSTAGSVLVVYKDAEGKELGRYWSQDPMLARTCDAERGRERGLKPLPDGTVIELLLPDDPRIRSLEIGRRDQKPVSIGLEGQIEPRK